MPTFEERYGPWICCGCGKAHELGAPCSPLERAAADLDRALDIITRELIAVVDAAKTCYEEEVVRAYRIVDALMYLNEVLGNQQGREIMRRVKLYLGERNWEEMSKY